MPLRRVRAVRVYNGGADYTRYAAPVAFGFSPATVLDEFTLPPMVFEKGRFRAAEPRSPAARTLLFEVGLQRVHSSLHSEVATLPLSYRAKGIRECFFKIAYDPVLIERLKLLIDLGLTERRPGPARSGSARRAARRFARPAAKPPDFIDDRDCLAVVAEGEDAKGRGDRALRPHRAPAASAPALRGGSRHRLPALDRGAAHLLDGRIRERGVLPPERCVPVEPVPRGARRARPAARGSPSARPA